MHDVQVVVFENGVWGMVLAVGQLRKAEYLFIASLKGES